jgi:hypothetical protein
VRDLDITAVAKRSGVPASTLRYYEEKGLIRSIGRAGLRRVFDQRVLERLALIALGRAAGFSLEEMAGMFTADGKLVIPPAPARSVVDPTGCGDAYRAGLLHGLMHGLSWERTARIASLMGSLKIESRGTQNHSFTQAEFQRRYASLFGTT